MTTQEIHDFLIGYTNSIWFEAVYWLIISAVFCVIAYFVRKKDKNVKYYFLLLAAVFIGYACISAIPVYKDIRNSSYITENVEFLYVEGSNMGFKTRYYITVTRESGEKISLDYDIGDLPPEGRYYGTVIYAEHSKVFVKFTPEKELPM